MWWPTPFGSGEKTKWSAEAQFILRSRSSLQRSNAPLPAPFRLGTPGHIAYRPAVIGFLRFVGLMNAAVWFGAAVFFAFGVGPAATSSQMRDLIGANNFPYYSQAIGNLYAGRFFYLYSVCSVVALAYLGAEWLYFGKYPPRRWLALVMALVLLGMARGYGLQPALARLKTVEHGRASRVEERQAAARAFESWSFVARAVDILLASGLAVYLWRVGNPAEPTRFVGAKFRS